MNSVPQWHRKADGEEWNQPKTERGNSRRSHAEISTFDLALGVSPDASVPDCYTGSIAFDIDRYIHPFLKPSRRLI
jgi:hypothetical protein